MIKRVIVVLGHVAVFSAVVSMAGCRLCECDVDSVDVDDALLYEQVSVPDEDNAFIPLIAATNLLHRVEDECADEEDESIIFVKYATDSGSKMQEFNGELRIDAITKYINTNLNVAAMLCGLGQTQEDIEIFKALLAEKEGNLK